MALFNKHLDEDRKDAYRRGAWQAVIKYGEAGLKSDPKNIKILNDLAYAYYKKGQFDRAMELCETIYRLHPCDDLRHQAKHLGLRYMRYHEVLAEMYALRGMDKEAMAICRRLMEQLDPMFSKKYAIAAQIYARRGNLELAAAQYAAMAVRCPKHFKEALNGLMELAAQEPLHEAPFKELYSLYVEKGQLADVIARHERAWQSRQIDAIGFYLLAHMYHFTGAFDKEEEIARQWLKHNPDDPGPYVLLARIHQERREFPEASACMKKVMALAPEQTDRFKRLFGKMQEKAMKMRRDLEANIRNCMKNRQFHKAMQECERLVAMFPDDAACRQRMADAIDAALDVALAAGEVEKAIALLDRLSNFSDAGPAAAQQFARRQAQLADRAVDFYETQIEEGTLPAGEADETRLALAEIYQQRGNVERAVQHWKAILQSGSGQGTEEALFQLARHYLKAGNIQEAEPYIQRYSHQPCDSEKVKERKYGLARACVKVKLLHQARSLFDSICQADRSYRDVERQLQALNRPGTMQEIPEAVMVLDICESSRMMDLYGDGITNQIKNLLEEFMFPIFEQNSSKFCKSTGDGFLVCFPSVVQAVRSAVSILQKLESFNAESSDRPDVHLRFAIHFGSVRIRQDGDRHGTNVNIPFRVEGLKREGLIPVEGCMRKEELPLRDRILITEAAYRALSEKQQNCRFVGLFELRNITGLHRIYLVQP